MTHLKSFVVLFTLMLSIVFQVSEVYGAKWVRLVHHPVKALNDASTEVGLFGALVGANKVKRFADIEVEVYYQIYDQPNGSKAKSVVYSGVEIFALDIAFTGFGSISGTADENHTKQFAGQLKTDEGVLSKRGKVKTALMESDGRPIELGSSHFGAYSAWYKKAPDKQRKKYGDSETFHFAHPTEDPHVFYTAMQQHPVHFGEGFNLFTAMRLKKEKKARSLTLSEFASLEKQKVGNPSDADIAKMFAPYAMAKGESYGVKNKDMSGTVPWIRVDTTQPATKIPKKGDAGDYNFGILLAAEDVYTAQGGDTHEAVMYTSNSSKVEWYLKAPGDSGRGTLVETDTNTEEARYSFSFADDASGSYVITAVVSPASGPGYEGSYTVSVTPKSTSTTGTENTGSPMYSLVSSDGVYTAEAGTGHEANFSTTQAYSYVYWYVRSPSETGLGTGVDTDYGDSSSTTTAQLSYSFPSGVSGDYVITAYVYDGDGTTVYETSYTVTVSLPGSSTTPTTKPSSTKPPPSVSISPHGSYTSTTQINTGYGLVMTASEAISQVKWYYTPPGGSESRWDTQNFYDSTTTSSTCNIWFYDGTGEYEVRAEVTLLSSIAGVVHNATYTVTVTD